MLKTITAIFLISLQVNSYHHQVRKLQDTTTAHTDTLASQPFDTHYDTTGTAIHHDVAGTTYHHDASITEPYHADGTIKHEDGTEYHHVDPYYKEDEHYHGDEHHYKEDEHYHHEDEHHYKEDEHYHHGDEHHYYPEYHHEEYWRNNGNWEDYQHYNANSDTLRWVKDSLTHAWDHVNNITMDLYSRVHQDQVDRDNSERVFHHVEDLKNKLGHMLGEVTH